MNGYRPLFASPELHQDWDNPQKERSPTWPELFFDLFFVAAISNLGHLFNDEPDAANAGRVVLYHALVFFLWSDATTLKTRYSLRGLMFRSIGLCLQLGMLGLIIGSRADLKWHRMLAGGYAVARASLAVIQLIVARAVPRARVLCLLNAAAGAALVVAPAVTAWRESSEEAYRSHVIVMMATAVGEAVLPVLPSLVPKHDIPVNIDHMNKRLGQLVMLHLGEAALESTPQQFVGVALAATLVWSLHLNYFHVEPDTHEHAYRQSRLRGLLFFYCHWLLVVALLLTGSRLRLLLGKYPGPHHIIEDPPASHETALMLCVSYAASLHLLALTRAAHYLSLSTEHRTVRAVERAGVKGWWLGWWAMVLLWPVPVYFLPSLVRSLNSPGPDGAWQQGFQQEAGWRRIVLPGVSAVLHHKDGSTAHVGVTLLLCVLAAHAVLLTCSESLFAHMLTKTPVLESLTGPEPEGEGPAGEL